MNKKIALYPLVLLIVSAIDSIRTLPTTAFFGPSLVFFYLLSAAIFLIPVAFISAEFGSRFPEEGGVFHWVGKAFGDNAGVLAAWLQWINTMVWYPTMLVFISGTMAYIFHPSFVQSRVFLLCCSLGFFWILTLVNLRGVQVSVRLNSLCGLLGTLIPMGLIVLMGVWWMVSAMPSALVISAETLLPKGNFLELSGVVVTIMASFLGMELAGVHINDVFRPEKNFPKAVGISALVLLVTLVLGALAVAIVVPSSEIHFVDGVMQTFTSFLTSFNLKLLIPLLAVLIVMGGAGGSINWLISPAKGIFQAAESGFLPSYFVAKNRNGVPARILISQAVIVTVFCVLMHGFNSINEYYWFLMALSTGLYMLMYVLMFLAALKLGRPKAGYQIPRGLRLLSCLLGIMACVSTIVIGLLPPSGVSLTGRLNYVLLALGGFVLMVSPIVLFWYHKKSTIKTVN